MIISLWKMIELAEEIGFKVVGKTYSFDGTKKNPIIRGQHGLVLSKPMKKKKLQSRKGA